MKNVLKKITSIILVLAMLLCLSSCGDEKAVGKKKSEESVNDALGRTIYLDEDPKSATACSVYTPANQFFIALGIADRVLAINHAKAIWKGNYTALEKVGTVGTGDVDLEKLASYAPSALIHRSNDPKTIEAVENLGIDVICITVESMEDVESTLRTLGKYFGAEEKAEETCEWIEKKFAYIDKIVAKIPESERKTALCLGGELGKIAGNDMLQTWMIEKAGGIPVADVGENHNWLVIGEEKVLEYDPEVLFCTSSTRREYNIEDFKTNGTWSAMKCVKAGEIYAIPCTLDSWDMPGLSAVLGTMFMLNKMYPEYFTEDDLFYQMDQFYKYMFGRTFSLEELGYE